jgi:hypothetical protein
MGSLATANKTLGELLDETKTKLDKTQQVRANRLR